ncbi:MAG TPA: glycosyltransferase family A protein [Longimicrobium sp.]|nr:glycosyltransferase family A protein [Longimicrobium sp.]
MSPPLVTVLITTFRRPHFLQHAIDSVLKQTYRSIELIVVDDNGEGTPDQLETAEVVGRIQDPRLGYHALKHNAGPSAARNAGIAMAHGAYVAFLDDDDLMLPDKLDKQLQYMESHDDYGGCGSWLRRFYDNGFSFDVTPPDGIDVFMAVAKREQTYSTCTLFLKRQALLDVGMFDPEFRGLEDPELVMRFSLRYPFGIVEEVLTLVRTRDETESAEWHEKWQAKLLEKHEQDIGRLPPADKRQVYFNCYFNLSKKHLQNRNYRKAFQYFVRCKRPLKYSIQLVNSARVYMRKKRALRQERGDTLAAP